jgi:periplasmic divalent cation tolerance protein
MPISWDAGQARRPANQKLMPDQRLIVLCTVPNREVGSTIAESLVSERLAACVNIVPEISSIYRWQGKTQADTELLLIIKTNANTYQRLERRVQSLHPYELPEIIAVPISRGLPDYLAWIDANAGVEE